MQFKKVTTALIFIMCCEITNGYDIDYYANRCDVFHGQLPDTFLDQCTQAKFMTRNDYECYDKAYKNE